MLKKYIECGEIVGTHGVKGEVRINPWTDNPAFLKKFDKLYKNENGTEFFEVLSIRPANNIVLARFSGVDTVEKAREFRGTVLYIDRDSADIGERHFVTELLGCRVLDFDTKEEYGVITDVMDLPANDVWQIEKNEKTFLLPAIDEVIKLVDVQNEIIFIKPMKGIFDDED